MQFISQFPLFDAFVRGNLLPFSVDKNGSLPIPNSATGDT